MSVRKSQKKAVSKANTQLPTLHPHAAGIDIGATEMQVAVPCDADPDPAPEPFPRSPMICSSCATG